MTLSAYSSGVSGVVHHLRPRSLITFSIHGVERCQTAESFSEGNAVLLVYLVDGEKDIYIGVLVALVATVLAGLRPAESFSCLGVAESLRTGK